MADIPEDSNVDTESNGVGLGEYDLESDGDNDRDGDYVDDLAPNPTESDEDDNKVEEQSAVEIVETAPSCTKQKKKARSRLELYIT